MDTLAAVTAVAAARAVAAVRQGSNGREAATASTAAAETDHTELSPGGRLVEALLTGDAHPASTAMTAAPLLPAAPTAATPAVLAQALERGLRQSGLFYESHLAGWVQGEYPLAELLQEPQAQLPALPPLASGDLLPAPGAGTSLPQADDAQAGGLAGLPGHASWPAEVDPRAGGLVQQQLQTLDTQVVPWQGQVWPDQHATWKVAAQVDPDQRGNGAPPQAWNSQLRLELPALGAVEADLQWAGARCSVHLTVPAVQLPAMRAALPILAQALSAAGIRADRIQLTARRDHELA